jgi:hypothetical protein
MQAPRNRARRSFRPPHPTCGDRVEGLVEVLDRDVAGQGAKPVVRPRDVRRTIERTVLCAFAGSDPAVTTGTAKIEIGKLLAGFVRPR